MGYNLYFTKSIISLLSISYKYLDVTQSLHGNVYKVM